MSQDRVLTLTFKSVNICIETTVYNSWHFKGFAQVIAYVWHLLCEIESPSFSLKVNIS